MGPSTYQSTRGLGPARRLRLSRCGGGHLPLRSILRRRSRINAGFPTIPTARARTARDHDEVADGNTPDIWLVATAVDAFAQAVETRHLTRRDLAEASFHDPHDMVELSLVLLSIAVGEGLAVFVPPLSNPLMWDVDASRLLRRSRRSIPDEAQRVRNRCCRPLLELRRVLGKRALVARETTGDNSGEVKDRTERVSSCYNMD